MGRMRFKVLCYFMLVICLTEGCGRRRRRSSPPKDTTRPQIHCPPNIEEIADPGQVTAWISWVEPIVTDNKDTGLKAIPCGKMPNTRFSEGTTPVSYYTKDHSNNKNDCTFYVTVTVLHCDPPPSIDNGYYQFYPSKDFRYGGVAFYGCYRGYERHGLASLECRRNEQWSGSAPECKKISCPLLSGDIPNGKASCTDFNRFQSQCTYTCASGYRVKSGQSKVRVCGFRGQWLGLQPTCVDAEAPIIHNCPTNMLAYTDEGKETATQIWLRPHVTDNSGESIGVILERGEVNIPYSVGTHSLLYTATDSAGNKARPCQFTVTVRRLTCHTIYPAHGLVVTCEEGFGYGAMCEFACQYNATLQGERQVTCSKYGYPHHVKWSWHQGMPTCEDEVCPALDPPLNGALACDNWLYGRHCKMLCSDQYDVPISKKDLGQSLFVCGNQGLWNLQKGFTVPGCTKTVGAAGYRMPFQLNYFSGNCCDESTTFQIQEKFIEFLHSISDASCTRFEADCTVENVQVSCDQNLCHNSNKRKKRSTETFTLTIEATLWYASIPPLNISSEGEHVDINEALNDFKQTLADRNLTIATNGSQLLVFNSLKTYNLQIECGEGLQPAPSGAGCVGCESGSYFSRVSQECEPCPVGTYNDGSELFNCTMCPPFTTTATNSSKSPEQCIDYCPPGKYSAEGTVPCTPCPIGSFSEAFRTTECTECPAATTTAGEMSTSYDDCQAYTILVVPSTNESFGIFEQHFAADTRLLSVSVKVLLTETGSPNQLLSIDSDQEPLIHLSTSNITQLTVDGEMIDINIPLQPENWNSLLIELTFGSSTTAKGYVNGIPFEEVFQSPTDKVPSGADIIIGSKYGVNHSFELADVNIWGKEIDDEILTVSKTCNSSSFGSLLSWNDVVSQIELNYASIKVPSSCDVLDDCLSQPCGNHTCVDGVGYFTCICNDGFSGKLCDFNIDDCDTHACENGATCIDAINGYTCFCPEDFKGDFCENEKVNGGWSEWGEWSACTQSCNNGTQARLRGCDQPEPGPDGLDCEGVNSQEQLCNPDICPVCSAFDEPEHGYTECDYDPVTDMNNCTIHCNTGYAFAYEVRDNYTCGYYTGYEWNIDSPVLCTEVEAPTQISAHHTLTYDLACTKESVAAIDDMIQSNLNQMPCVKTGECSVDSVNIIGNGCPVHVADVDSIDVDIIVSISSLSDQDYSAATGESIMSELYTPASALLESATLMYYMAESGNFTISTPDGTYSVTSQTVEPVILCHSAGYVWLDYYCVPCPPGSFGRNYECYECPRGSYQEQAGQAECQSCPKGLFTISPGSDSFQECIVSPTEEDVCGAYTIRETPITVGWLCINTEFTVEVDFLQDTGFRDLKPHLEISTEQGQLINTCDDDCVTVVDESDLDKENIYYVSASVPNSETSCRKAMVINYKWLSPNGILLTVALPIVALIVVAVALRCRAKNKVGVLSKTESKPQTIEVSSAPEKYKI